MNPEDVASALQPWINKNPNVPMAAIRSMIIGLLKERYYVDPVKRQVLDAGLEGETGNRKEGFQIRIVRSTVDDWKVSYAKAEVSLPVPGTKSRTVTSSDQEPLSICEVFLSEYGV